jgi:hypothetical protein
MAAGQKLVIAVVMALAGVSVVHADMMPVGAAGPQSPPLCEQPLVRPAGVSDSRAHYPGATDLDLASVEPFPEANAEMGQLRHAKSLHVFAYEPGSVNLCLYALIGLGLCKSAPWVRKLSFGFIPDWYHDGGPYQIGHSRAIGPESLCHAAICCFIQPDRVIWDLISQHYLGNVASLLHKSLFVPGRLASRGPPACV